MTSCHTEKGETKTFSFISRWNSMFEKQVLCYWENACQSDPYILLIGIPTIIMKKLYPKQHKHSWNKAKENTDEAKACNSNYFSCKWGNLSKTIISKINTLDIYQIICTKSSYLCKESKDLHPVQYFPATLKLLTMCMNETWFSKHTFKRTRWFLRIRKIFDKLSRPKIR